MEYSIKKSAVVKFESNYLYNSHNHNHYEIIYMISGQCMMLINNIETTFSEGECIIINKNIQHNFYVNGKKGCKIQQLEIDCDVCVLTEDFVRITITKAQFFSLCLNKIHVFYNEKSYANIRNVLIELEIKQLALLTNEFGVATLTDNDYIKQAVKDIKDNYLSEIYCDKIAKKLGISERYLRKIFVADLGIPPKEYIINLRLEKAKSLLINTNEKIADIAMMVGYNTIQYFSIVFKSRTGVTPSEFREINKLSER